MKALLLLLVLVLAGSASVNARSSTVRQRWYTQHHAQLDHWKSLECGGPDAVSNLHFTFGPKEQVKEHKEQLVRHKQLTCKEFLQWLDTQSCTPDWCVP